MKYPNPYYVKAMTAEEFLLELLELGTPIEVSMVGVFDEKDTVGRGSRRDMDLPPHKDGVYSAKLAKAQGGHYVEKPDIDIVGLYCLRGGNEPCFTVIYSDDGTEIGSVNLQAGQALIFDNQRILHGRRGPVGDRILIRYWLKRK